MKLSFDQMIIGLDKLFFTAPSNESKTETIERADTIESYLESVGWNWNLIIQHMINECN